MECENEKNLNLEDKKQLTTKSHLLNQILYGPPGTGKTYNAVKKP